MALRVAFGLNAQSPEAFEAVSIEPRTGERAVGGLSAPDRFVRVDSILRA